MILKILTSITNMTKIFYYKGLESIFSYNSSINAAFISESVKISGNIFIPGSNPNYS